MQRKIELQQENRTFLTFFHILNQTYQKGIFILNCNANNYENRYRGDNYRSGFSEMPIGMAYVPWQKFRNLYELDRALQVGTIFAELDKPFTGKGGRCNERCM